MARLTKQFESATTEWATPSELFDPLNIEFGFTLDVAASAENTKCRKFYSKATDGLTSPWSGVCWMNPPYGRGLSDWMRKAAKERNNGVTSVCLIPARTNTNWFHDVCLKHGEVRFVRGRPKFGGADQGLPWPLLIIVFRAINSK